jgi:hypothetical protein
VLRVLTLPFLMPNAPKESGPQAGASYVSYLLRMWATAGASGEGDAKKWLASVESPLTQEQCHFADLESLFAFLRTMTGQPPACAHAPGDVGVPSGRQQGESENLFNNISTGLPAE